MSEKRIKELEERVKKIESTFALARTVALCLGVSVATLAAWVWAETGKVVKLTADVNRLEPMVTDAKTQLAQAGSDQLALIKSKAEPIVTQLAKDNFKLLNAGFESRVSGLEGQTNELELDTFFIYRANVCYTHGNDYHNWMDQRKKALYGNFKRKDLDAAVTAAGYPCQ